MSSSQHRAVAPERIAFDDPSWIAARVQDTAARWGSPDPRVNATLWWYAASRAIADAPVGALCTGASIPRPDPTRGWLRDTGYLGALATDGVWAPEEIAAGLVAVCATPIRSLAAAGGISERPLWAVLSDSIGNVALLAGPVHAATATRLVTAMRNVGAPMPAVRFQDVAADGALTDADVSAPPDAGHTRATRRSSCCLIHLTTETPNQPAGMCASCPRQGRGRGVAMAQALFRR